MVFVMVGSAAEPGMMLALAVLACGTVKIAPSRLSQGFIDQRPSMIDLA
jgi:hypothetical protein